METIRAGNVDLSVVDRGQGLPILFAHGFPLDHTMWQAQIDEFSKTHRVIVPDLRGFGASQVSPGTTSMEQFADDVAALLDALEITEPIVFCGLSMGGYVGWQFWRRHAARLKGLVQCDTKSKADTAEAAAGRMKMVDHVLRSGAEVVAEAMPAKLFAPATYQTKPQIVESIKQTIGRTHPEGIAAALRGMAARPDMTSELRNIQVPSLIVCGQHDAISPVEEMREIANGLPSAHFVVISDAGHMSPMEEPARFNEALRTYLRSL
jgi:pimeloyl-ACP methyl ester carboxylesterase